MYSKPELETQAKGLLDQIIVECGKIGILATLSEGGDGIKIAEYYYDVVDVSEKRSSGGFSSRALGALEVRFRSIHLGRGCLCSAKRFKIDTKDLMSKIVSSIKERRDAIIALKKQESMEDKSKRAHQKVLKTLRENYPEFEGNIEHDNSRINLSFRNLSEDKARWILKTLRDAGIHGSTSSTPADQDLDEE